MGTMYIDSVGLAADVRPLLAAIARRDQELARRLRRACDEVPEHIAEGMCLTGRQRRQRYGQAGQAASEALACLRAAEGEGIQAPGFSELGTRLQRLIGRLSGGSEPINALS
jgi:biotin carboxylase